MSVLTASEILKMREQNFIKIDPFEFANLGSNSYDLTLHNELQIYKSPYLDPKIPKTLVTKKIKIPETGYLLHAGKCYLARTREHTYTWDLVPTLHGKSSIGRMFLDISTSAGYGDIGFNGYWTLQLVPHMDVIIYPGMKIIQIQYETVKGIVRQTYNGKYQNSNEIIPSKAYKDFAKKVNDAIK